MPISTCATTGAEGTATVAAAQTSPLSPLPTVRPPKKAATIVRAPHPSWTHTRWTRSRKRRKQKGLHRQKGKDSCFSRRPEDGSESPFLLEQEGVGAPCEQRRNVVKVRGSKGEGGKEGGREGGGMLSWQPGSRSADIKCLFRKNKQRAALLYTATQAPTLCPSAMGHPPQAWPPRTQPMTERPHRCWIVQRLAIVRGSPILRQ